MKDSVGEEERRVQEETMAQGKKREREEEEGAVVGGGEEGGFLRSVASKIGAAMPTNGSGTAEEDGVGHVNGNAVTASDGSEEEKKDGNGGGGFFHNLLSSAPAPEPVSEEVKDKDEGGGEQPQAGILSTMASKIGMAMSGANGNGNRAGEEDTKASNGDAVDHSKGEGKVTGDEPNGGGGIVKQFMSNLPSSDDRGPEADEASLLISIIED